MPVCYGKRVQQHEFQHAARVSRVYVYICERCRLFLIHDLLADEVRAFSCQLLAKSCNRSERNLKARFSCQLLGKIWRMELESWTRRREHNAKLDRKPSNSRRGTTFQPDQVYSYRVVLTAPNAAVRKRPRSPTSESRAASCDRWCSDRSLYGHYLCLKPRRVWYQCSLIPYHLSNAWNTPPYSKPLLDGAIPYPLFNMYIYIWSVQYIFVESVFGL